MQEISENSEKYFAIAIVQHGGFETILNEDGRRLSLSLSLSFDIINQ